MRLLHGEVSAREERALKELLAQDEQARSFYRSLQELWDGLELPPAEEVAPDLAAAAITRLRRESRGREVSWRSAPVWVRATTAAAALAGILLGVGAATLVPAEDPWMEGPAGDSVVEGYVEALIGGAEDRAPDGEMLP